MDSHLNLSNWNIEKLVKTSKQLQNKIRQDLMRCGKSSPFVACGEREQLPPIWDKIMLHPYVKNVVADYILDSSILPGKSDPLKVQADVAKPVKQNELTQRDSGISTRNIATERVKPKNDSTVILRKISANVGTQVMRNKLPPRLVSKNVHPKGKRAPFNGGTQMHNSGLRSSASEVSKLRSQSEKYHSSSTHRLPLQRFAGNFKRNIDFSKEHPNIELDMSSNQTTLFPRRYWSDSKRIDSMNASPENDFINLATAKMKPPNAASAEVNKETWKEVLQKNRITEKPHKVLRLKRAVEVINDCKKIPEHEIKEPKDLDIIFTPANGLFHLEKQAGRLSKQTNYNHQRFPVMYIRPERQVQQVAHISIRGESESNAIHPAVAKCSTNVRYIECTHEETVKEGVSLPKVEIEITSDKQVQVTSNEENKFFKALKFTEVVKDSSISRDSSPATSKSSFRSQSGTSSPLRNSFSACRIQETTSTSTVDTSDNDVHHIMEGMLSSSDGPRTTSTKDAIKNLPILREVYVQTDFKEIYQTNTIPLPIVLPPPKVTPVIETFDSLHQPIADCCRTTNQGDDKLIEDDFITKIFERIRNDIPNALQAFKDRNTTSNDAESIDSHIVKQHPEQLQGYHHQMSVISKASNVESLPNEIEERLTDVQAKKEDCNHTILHLPPPFDSSVTIQSSPVGVGGCKPLMLQQNPLFAQTINRIKSSAIEDDAMPGDGGMKEDRYQYPTDAEIKRAVKIFLDSLTLDGSADGKVGGRNSIIKADVVRKKAILPRLELISSARYKSSIILNTSDSSSSISSDDRNIRRKSANEVNCRVSKSSTSTAIPSSDPESESDSTVDPHRSLLAHMAVNSFSEGEVLSVGEV